MSFSVGIVGLPNVGKSTLFKALTKKKVDIASYPFTTIDPNVGIVIVPDKRIEKIASLVKPEKITNTIIEFVDIAGLVKNAHKGEGLGNQFLSHIRGCDAIVEVLREFEDPNIEHTEGEIDPEKDIKTIETELLMKDLETLEKIFDKTEREASKEKSEIKKKEILKIIKIALSEKKPIREINLSDEEKKEIKEYQFLTEKPVIYIFNISKQQAKGRTGLCNFLSIDLKIEEEASEFSDSEKEELKIKSELDQLIIACYNALDLITFFTITGKKEARAWTLEKGSTAIKAAGKVHSDFEERFIRAEVIPWQRLVDQGSWSKAKEKGQIKTAGKDYIVQDGDIIEFKI